MMRVEIARRDATLDLDDIGSERSDNMCIRAGEQT